MAIETLFAISAGVSALGTGIGAISSYQAAKTQEATASANAAQARLMADAEAGRAERSAKRQLASARAAQGASGVLVGQGSSLAVISDMAAQHAENALNIRYGGEVNRANALNRASAYGQKASGALLGGAVGMPTGLLKDTYTSRKEFGKKSVL